MTRKQPRALTRWIADDYGTLAYYKRCTKCHRWLTLDQYSVKRRDRATGRVIQYDGWCRDDRNSRYRERWASLPPERKREIEARRTASRQTTPERIEKRRRSNREAARRARLRDHERVRLQHRDSARRRYARIKADPERYAEYLTRARMNYRLRREAKGKPVRPGPRTVVGAYRSGNGGRTDIALDPLPLRLWLEAVVAAEVHDGQDLGAFCRSIGWQDRQLRDLRKETHRTVSLHTADRLLTGYGRPVVIRTRDLERGLVEWAQEQPDNGTRLLRYLDRAETVAHLADRSLLFLSDLWPRELGE